MLRLLAAVLWIGISLARGQTYVVDINNGPGAQFSQIQAAVSAVPSGSTLIVRPGAYQSVVIDGKGVVILCHGVVTAGAGSAFINFLTIQNTLPQHEVAVYGLRMGGGGAFGLYVTNCLGPVTYDGLGRTLPGWLYGAPVDILNSNQVAIRGVHASGRPGSQVVSSSVVFENCTLQGYGAFFSNKALGSNGAPGLLASDSQVQAVRTVLLGGSGAQGMVSVRPGREAVVLTNSSFRAMGSSNHSITGGTTPGVGQLPAIEGTGIARVDPLIVMTGTPAAGPGITLLLQTMPSVVSQTAPPAGVLQVERAGAAGGLTALLISLRGSPLTLVGFDPIWVDLQTAVVETLAVTTSAPLVVQKLVPNQPALLGCQIVWQAADLNSSGLLAVSNPSPSFVR